MQTESLFGGVVATMTWGGGTVKVKQLGRRLRFSNVCPRCNWDHPNKVCPRCADVRDLDTAWSSSYTFILNELTSPKKKEKNSMCPTNSITSTGRLT